MKKMINYATLLTMMLLFVKTNAQNTATTSGNWNNCATWGSPLTIFNNTTDTKIINNGITVTQNTAWSTNNVILNGTGGITFASQANSIDFVNDAGPDLSCCTIVTPTASITQPSCSNNKKGIIVFNTQTNAEYSITNGSSYQSNPTFTNLDPGTYTLKVRSTTNQSCVTSTIDITLNNPGECCVINQPDCSINSGSGWTVNSSVTYENCGIGLNSGNSRSGGTATISIATVIGRTYKITTGWSNNGSQALSTANLSVYTPSIVVSQNIPSPPVGVQYFEQTFVANSTTTIITITDTSPTTINNDIFFRSLKVCW